MPHKYRFKRLDIQPREDEASAQIGVACKITGKRLPWNQAARAGWVADLNGPAFNAYYSPEGRARVEAARPFVALEGLKHGNRFYTTNTPGNDPTKLADGSTAYRVLGYADTDDEARRILYPNPGDAERAQARYVFETMRKMHQLGLGNQP